MSISEIPRSGGHACGYYLVNTARVRVCVMLHACERACVMVHVKHVFRY
jgi:hypothetical protein